jgi:Uma2 family endonuclease
MLDAAVQTGVMPLSEFIARHSESPFELIDGVKVPMSPTRSGHTYIIHLMLFALHDHVQENNLGEVYAEAVFILEDKPDWVKGSRTPDLSFFARERIEAYRAAHPDWKDKPFVLVPDLVIEAPSSTDLYSAVRKKVEQYLAAGVRLVVIIDPETEQVELWQPGSRQIVTLRAEDIFSAGDIIPGFSMPIGQIFA